MAQDPQTYVARRAELLERIGPGVAVFPSAPVSIRNNDVEHEYRQDSDFFYLSGFDEPESVLVVSNLHPEHQAVLFVRPRHKEREIWDGPRAGVEGAARDFGVDAAFPIDELEQRLPDYLQGGRRVHAMVGRGGSFDAVLFRALATVRGRARSGAIAPTEIVDPSATLHEMRLRKRQEELAQMRRAARVTRDAHVEAMKATQPGKFEYEIKAEINRVFQMGGSDRPAYDSIVGSGPNATILHYRASGRKMEDGDLLLIDAGCELGYYASDVTRTFPVNGKFSAAQKALYDVVLASQIAAVEAIRPGVTLDDLHDVAARVITKGLIDHGLLQGTVDENIESGDYRAFFMHKTSHWIGMDVHDVGAYFVDGTMRPLEPGFVLTVEPGVYVSVDADVDPKWRGIGIRIEDDILVTNDGFDNLTADIPKTTDEIEAVMAG